MKLQTYENQFGHLVITFGNKIATCCNYSVKLLTLQMSIKEKKAHMFKRFLKYY